MKIEPGEVPIPLRARIASQLCCPKGCPGILRNDDSLKTCSCDTCKSIYALPTIEIREINPTETH